jgi:hypothetical protein
MVFENKQPMITQQIILSSLSTSELRWPQRDQETGRQAAHRGDTQKDKEIAWELNDAFASVFTLENKAVEEREETYYVKERPSSNRDIKGNQSR